MFIRKSRQLVLELENAKFEHASEMFFQETKTRLWLNLLLTGFVAVPQ